MQDDEMVEVNLEPEVMGILEELVKITGYTPLEILLQGLFLFYPELIDQLEISELKLWFILTNSEEEFLDQISQNVEIPKNELITRILTFRKETNLESRTH